MNLQTLLQVIFLSGMIAGCGVKGDPLAPNVPPEIGRGRPTYRRAAKELALPSPRKKFTKEKTAEDQDESDEN